MIIFQLNVDPGLAAEVPLQPKESSVSSQRHRRSPDNILDRDRISEMQKLVHELDNNLSISSQQSSLSSKEQKCDACIHTQQIFSEEG